MKRGMKILSAAALAFALSACGGGNGAKLSNKDDAARAAFGAGQSGQNVSNQAALMIALQQAASVDVGVKASCRNGHGSVALSLSSDTTQTTGAITYKLSFDGCEAGDYKDAKGTLVPVDIDGDVTYAVAFDSTSVSLTLDGTLDFSGGIDDSLQLQKLALTAGSTVTGTTTTYSVTLSGTIKTNEATFTYDSSYHLDGVVDGTFTGTAAAGNT